MARKGILAAVVVLLALASPAHGCLWDYDTLRDEKRGLPGMADILAGQWERHSRFFYQHRVAAMRAKLAARSDDWDAMDNLAVAHAKLDDLDAAIAVMLDKEKRHPGQYTTASNLGTFYMFKGDLPAAIAQLKKALAINPNAHFGREEYQLRLAEFLLQARAVPADEDYDFMHVGLDDEQWAALARRAAATQPIDDAADLLATDADLEIGRLRREGRRRALSDLGLKANVFDGVIGMIRFGTNRSPELYYALGDLLASQNDKSLAYRAYQRALESGHPRPEAVRQAMDDVHESVQLRASLEPSVITAERAAADTWVADYQKFEDDLVRAGKDTDDETNYASFYATHPRTLATSDVFLADYWARYKDYVAVVTGVVLVIGLAIVREIRRRRTGGTKRRSFWLN